MFQITHSNVLHVLTYVNSKLEGRKISGIAGLVCGRASGRREKGWVFLCELVGLWSCAAVHGASFGNHLHVSDFHGAIYLAAVPGSCGVLAAVAIAVGSRGRGAGSRCDVGHGSGYPNGVSDVRFQILSGHELDSLRRLGLGAGLLGGLCAGLAGLRPGLA